MTNKVKLSNSKEFEQIVLGIMLTDDKALKKASDALEEKNFYYEEHKIIFRALKKGYKNNKPGEIHIIYEHLKNENELSLVGGPGYIISLAQLVGTSTHVEYYIDQLIDISTKSNLIETLINCNQKSIEEISKILDEKLRLAINRKTTSSFYQQFLEPSSEKQVIDEIQNCSSWIKVGLKIGTIDLELPGGAITVVAAPTSHGKSTMLINLALGLLKNNPEKSVYFFSYEECKSAIISQFLNISIGKEISVNNRRSIESFFRDGNCKYVEDEKRNLFLKDKNAFFKTLIENSRLNVFYLDLPVEQLVQAIQFLRKNRKDIGAIFIDYIQFLNLLERGKLSRQEQLKNVCLILKDCAIETGLPIVLAAQFSRQVTCEADLSPIYISEAGDIERIACLILGFWNRNFVGFSREGNKTKGGQVISEPRSEIYMEVLKGRKIGNGHNSILNFQGNTGKIDNFLTDNLYPSQFLSKGRISGTF